MVASLNEAVSYNEAALIDEAVLFNASIPCVVDPLGQADSHEVA